MYEHAAQLRLQIIEQAQVRQSFRAGVGNLKSISDVEVAKRSAGRDHRRTGNRFFKFNFCDRKHVWIVGIVVRIRISIVAIKRIIRLIVRHRSIEHTGTFGRCLIFQCSIDQIRGWAIRVNFDHDPNNNCFTNAKQIRIGSTVVENLRVGGRAVVRAIDLRHIGGRRGNDRRCSTCLRNDSNKRAAVLGL